MANVLAAPVRRILNMKEAAAYLGMSVTTFRECVAPKVQSIKLMRSRPSYDVEDLNGFINQVSGKTAPPTEQNFWDKYR